MKVFVAAEAESDLLQIYAYVAERNPDAAEDIARQFAQKVDNLARFPFIGRHRNGFRQGLRSVVVGTYVIFYLVGDAITIVRVLDGRRDIDSELQR